MNIEGRIGFAPFRPFHLGAIALSAQSFGSSVALPPHYWPKSPGRLWNPQLLQCSKVGRGDREPQERATNPMRNYLLAAAAAAAFATPAMARDGSGYVGLEGGALFPKSQHVNATVDFTNPLVTDIGDTRVATIKNKTGYDVDLIGGYDFGMFRLEGELGYKRSSLKSARFNDAFLTASTPAPARPSLGVSSTSAAIPASSRAWSTPCSTSVPTTASAVRSAAASAARGSRNSATATAPGHGS